MGQAGSTVTNPLHKQMFGRFVCGVSDQIIGSGFDRREFVRHYQIYVPLEICMTGPGTAAKRKNDKYPGVIWIPGSGHNSQESKALGEEFFEHAKRAQMIFVTITPWLDSWNADDETDCCNGRKWADDVAHIRDIAWMLLKEVPISPKAFYLAGHGSGAVMAVASSNQLWVRGLILFGGSKYRFEVDKPKPIFIQWALDDEEVKFNGCCKKGDCIGGMHTENCVAAPAIFERWLSYNHCGADTRPSWFPTGVTNDTGMCIEGIDCHSPTSFCRYWQGGHRLKVPQPKDKKKHARSPIRRAVGWMQREACSHHGHWDEAYRDQPGKECRCPKSDQKRPVWGRYCLSKGSRPKKGSNWIAYTFIVVGVVMIGTTVAYAFLCDTTGYQKLDEMQPVQPNNSVEDGSEDGSKDGPHDRAGDIELQANPSKLGASQHSDDEDNLDDPPANGASSSNKDLRNGGQASTAPRPPPPDLM